MEHRDNTHTLNLLFRTVCFDQCLSIEHVLNVLHRVVGEVAARNIRAEMYIPPDEPIEQVLSFEEGFLIQTVIEFVPAERAKTAARAFQ